MAAPDYSEVNVSIALFKNTENKSITSIIMIKDKNKEVYTSPITEALELCFEGALMDASPFFGGTGFPGGDTDDTDYGGF